MKREVEKFKCSVQQLLLFRYSRKASEQEEGRPGGKQRSGLEGPSHPQVVLAHPGPSKQPIGPIPFAMLSATSLLRIS
eukprot:1154615-Pelagomonas_calceolata.AAC.2